MRTQYIHFTESQKEQVRHTDLAALLESRGEIVKKQGKEYVWRNGSDRVTLRGNLWFHQYERVGGDAPNSGSAEILSKALDNRTVMSGSDSRSKNAPSKSLQMIERPLLIPDELKSLPKGQFVVMKTGAHTMQVKLKLFFKWGIEFDEDNPYTVADNGRREVKYAEKQEIVRGILKKYPPKASKENETKSGGMTAPVIIESQNHESQQTIPNIKKGGVKPITPNKRTPLSKPEVCKNEPT